MAKANHPARSRWRGVALALAGSCALLLVACHQAPPPPSNVTPEKAVATNLRLAAGGDFDGLLQNRLPPADYAVWRQDWERAHAHPEPASTAQAQQFAKIMQMLTAPGAEAALLKRLGPEFSVAGKRQPQPVLASILAAAGKQAIAASPQLGPAQRQMALQGLNAVLAWGAKADFGNQKKLAKAIALACATARELHVQTLAQWRALDYATSMRDYGLLWNGLQQLLKIYGLDVAKRLTDATITTGPVAGNAATVHVALTLAGAPVTGTWPMRRVAGHWYDAAMLDAWQKAHPAAPAPAATTAAPAPTASAAAASNSVAPAASGSTAAAAASSG